MLDDATNYIVFPSNVPKGKNIWETDILLDSVRSISLLISGQEFLSICCWQLRIPVRCCCFDPWRRMLTEFGSSVQRVCLYLGASVLTAWFHLTWEAMCLMCLGRLGYKWNFHGLALISITGIFGNSWKTKKTGKRIDVWSWKLLYSGSCL